mgnify:CR=1 FL=1
MDTKPNSIRDITQRYSVKVVAEATPEMIRMNQHTICFVRSGQTTFELWATDAEAARSQGHAMMSYYYQGYTCMVVGCVEMPKPLNDQPDSVNWRHDPGMVDRPSH